jgi:hypothetical protein
MVSSREREVRRFYLWAINRAVNKTFNIVSETLQAGAQPG